MNLETLTVEELKNGYTVTPDRQIYYCNFCSQFYETGEIYMFGNRYWEASKAIIKHIQQEHGDISELLLHMENKYNTFTVNQKDLLSLIHTGLSDKEIAKKLDISPSTVRHQKFMFREKAKQAKMYLAAYELVMDKRAELPAAKDEDILPIHNSATMVDDRYIITEQERRQTLEAVFESLQPLKLKTFPPKQKKKLIILMKIAEQLESEKRYSEKELNTILKDIYSDYAVIRRYLIEYGFMDRTKDCKEYWLK